MTEQTKINPSPSLFVTLKTANEMEENKYAGN